MKCSPALTVTAPRGGYVVPARMRRWVGEKLALHGIEFTQLRARSSRRSMPKRFAPPRSRLRRRRSRAARPLALEGAVDKRAARRPGGLAVRADRAGAARCCVMTLLEPHEPDSLVSWGFFNTAFERKEYMEAYVAEEVARADAEEGSRRCAQEFEQRLAKIRSSPAIRRRASTSSTSAARRGTSVTTSIRCTGSSRRCKRRTPDSALATRSSAARSRASRSQSRSARPVPPGQTRQRSNGTCL